MKHFLQKDGTAIAHVYSDDIHYLKNGTYEEIDNTLRMHGDFIANVSNAFKASFSTSTVLYVEGYWKSAGKMEYFFYFLNTLVMENSVE